MKAVRLLYVSRFRNDKYSKSELYNILTQAITFNTLNKVYGALYFGNNYFTQCLEGTEDNIKDLFYNKILKDPRHSDCEILLFEPIEFYLFSKWHMRYANIHKDLISFFNKNHDDGFNPYLLDSTTIPIFIELLRKHEDSLFKVDIPTESNESLTCKKA